MTFKTGDRVVVNNINWQNMRGVIVESTRKNYGFPVRFDEFNHYLSGADYHDIAGPDISLEDGVATDAINPTHYQFPGGIQVIDLTRHLGFLEGNIVKYVSRAGRKGAAKEDLLKARQYLDWLIEDTND